MRYREIGYDGAMIDREEMARAVRTHRIRLGMTQQQLAQRARVGIATVKRIEGGHGASLTTLHAIARALGVDLGDLVGVPAGRASVSSLIDSWVEGERLRPRLLPPVTDDEIAWLRGLPEVFWIELPPTEATLEALVRARRSASS